MFYASISIVIPDLNSTVKWSAKTVIFSMSFLTRASSNSVIDQAFEIIRKISAHEDDEVYMIEKTVLDRFYDEDDLAVLKEYVVPEEGKKAKYAISYGVFLGYNFGILPSGRSDDELLDIMQEKLEQDAQQHAAYISQKIKDCGLENHAFYFYLLPLNDAETEKKTIMQHVLDGDVDL